MKTIILILIPLTLSGCFAPSSVFTLTPTETEVHWVNGIGMVNKNAQGISIMAGYVENHGNLFTFDVIIKNESDKSILIDPMKFECSNLYYKSDDITKLTSKGPTSFAIDPESQIQQVNLEISRENADYETFTTWNTIGSVLNLFISVASIGREKSEEEAQADESRTEDIRVYAIERKNDHMLRIGSLNDKKGFWQTQVLRKTTLISDQSIEGKVFFKPLYEAEYIQLRFPIDSTCFEILFEQKEIRP